MSSDKSQSQDMNERANKKKLKILEAKKETLFKRLQTAYDISLSLDTEASQKIFRTRCAKLEEIEKEFYQLVENINEINLDLNEDYAVNFQPIDSFDELYSIIKTRLNELEYRDQVISNTAASDINKTTSKVKLPPFQVPKFSGRPQDWPLWYQTFKTMICDDPSLTDMHRMFFLTGALEGKAKAFVSELPNVGENFSLVWDALRERFEDSRLLANTYMETMIEFKPPLKETASSLDSFLQNFVSSAKAFLNLNLEDHSDYILFYLATARLHPDTVRQFECSLSISNNSFPSLIDSQNSTLPTFNQLIKFLREHAKMLARQPVTRNHITPLKKTSSFNNSSSSKSSHAMVVSKPSRACPACNKQHSLYYCFEFKNMNIQDRLNFVKQKGLCQNCLSNLHKNSACKSERACAHCGLRHHTLIHIFKKFGSDKFSENAENSEQVSKSSSFPAATQSETENSSVTCASLPVENDMKASTNIHNSVLLATARVMVLDKNQQYREVRALIDSASQSNIITLDCCNRLGLRMKRINTAIKGVGSVSNNVQYITRLTFYSRLNKKYSFDIDALVMKEITGHLPTAPLAKHSFSHLESLFLADENFHLPGKIDLLIGASVFPQLLCAGKIVGPPNTPVALKSCLGYILMGSASEICTPSDSQVLCTINKDNNLSDVISKFWAIEDLPASCSQPPSSEEEECEMNFNSTVSRCPNGRYSVTLPFKRNPAELGRSWHRAMQCLLALEKRLEEQPLIKKQYHAFLKDRLEQQHISRSEDSSDEGCFLPHHFVQKLDSVSTKLRVVWNASAPTTSGLSLNDVLHTGPKLHADLRSVMIRFRAFKIAASADLKQMFLQILIRPDQRKFQKFLWRFSVDEDVSVYTLNTVTFGVKPSPYLAMRTIKQLIADSHASWPQAVPYADRDFYIDDFGSSFTSLEEALAVYKSLTGLFQAGGFELVKWCSNSPLFLHQIPEYHRMPSDNTFLSDDTLKILGVRWTANSDNFIFNVSPPESANTKREILSLLARMFDPLGFISPVTVYIKLLLHDLWTDKFCWDTKLDPQSSIMKRWNNFLSQLPLIKDVKIPRYLCLQPDQSADLIGFCDASSKAYGAVIYVRTVLDNEIKTTLLTSRTKIASRNVISIPRLELCAALLLSRLFNFVVDSFSSIFNFENYFAFTDSSVALCWLSSSPGRWNRFVANRVIEIQSLKFKVKWYHIAGVENPADCLSRGLLPSDLLKHSLWFTGPPWLSQDFESWPRSPVNNNGEEFGEEKVLTVLRTEEKEMSAIRSLIDRLSSFNKLLRIMAYILRWKNIKITKFSIFITAEELVAAELVLAKYIQKQHFSNEYLLIEKNISCRSEIRKLHPFIDKNSKLIRVGGRLTHSDLNYSHKYPILLPKRDAFVNLLIDYYHHSNLHTGPNLVLSLIRLTYWILGGRSLVRQRIHKCNLCFRARPRANFPLMGDLPFSRITQSQPFLHTGVDYAGPFFVTPYKGRGVRSRKMYICLFICLCVKAIHLEVSSDLSTETFLNSFKRFIARRGPVHTIYSDCGTNFVGARACLNEIYEMTNSKSFNEKINGVLASDKINWITNSPGAPHMGGIWESQVKSVKTHLLKITVDQTLTLEEFTTVLAQIEALLNSRPLGLDKSHPNDLSPLTPRHFLNQAPLSELPANSTHVQSGYYSLRYELLDRLVNEFWRRWHVEYLHTLQTREKWNTPSNPIKVGTVVIVQHDSTPSLHWPLAVVEELHPGKDGIVRVATIRMGTSLYRRPVVKLCPLPSQ